MKDNIDIFVTHLKEDIQKKLGQDILYGKDCQVLSDLIQKELNRQVSVSTLKRFFGIIQSPFNPSKYTLDTLSIYLKFKNWQDFINSFEANKHVFSHSDSWDQLKKRVRVVTNYSLKSLKTKIGDQFTDFPERAFAIKKFEAFLNGPQIATAFIAPGGYGKSTIITQLTERYFTGTNAKYPNDAICLIDGGILVNLINQNIELNRLHSLLEYDAKTSFSNYFRENPDQVKGRFVLVIDGINEIYYQTEKLTRFIENLMDIITSYENISWYKLVVTCRPDNWKIFSRIIKQNPHLKTNWFDVSFEKPQAETINIPVLDKHEIKYFLKNTHSIRSFENLNFHYPEITEIINIPYLLHLFSLDQNTGTIHNDLELLNQFVYKVVLSEPYSEEKARILGAFFQLSELAKQKASVNKENLLKLAEFEDAYKELVFNNILYEFTVPGSYLSINTYVKFSHDILLEFFLANKWIKENTFDLELIRKIIHYYDNNPQLQCNVIKYIIKLAFKENNTSLLKDIYSIFDTDQCPSEIPCICHGEPDIINVIGVELRKNKAIRDYLIPLYAQSELGQFYYFESFFDLDCLVLHSGDNIKYYLENDKSANAQIYGHFLMFMQYFFAGEEANCKKEYELFQNFELSNNLKPRRYGFWYGVQIIYQTVFEEKLESDMIKKYYQKSDEFFESGAQTKVCTPYFEFLIILALNYGNRFTEILEFSKLILDRYDLSESSSSWFYQLFISIHARALLNTGRIQEGFELFNQVEFKTIPINQKYYMKLRYYAIQVEFLLFERKFIEAKKILEEIKTISQMLRFKYFYDQALMIETKIFNDTF